MTEKKLALIILDGWGHGTKPEVSAIAQANTPFIDSLYDKYPNSELKTDGAVVGLPDGQMGNSEVGHMNIGAGRIVYQDLLKINNVINDGSFKINAILNEAIDYAKNSSKPIHLLGLVSDGGVHSSLEHLKELCSIFDKHDLKDVFIHAFMDGRDTSPTGGIGYIEKLESHLTNSTGKVASIIGRYYAMDRDQRWERTKLAYDLVVHGIGERFSDSKEAIQASYDSGVTDEFIKPIVKVGNDNLPVASIKENDVVIGFNFRPDRMRQITKVLTQEDISDHSMQKIHLHYSCMTEYDASFKGLKLLFEDENLSNTIGEVIAQHGKKQIRIAETEKYPHVTYFFSGGREEPFEGENRFLIPSPKVATYDLQPEMSAKEVTETIIPEIEKGETDFICLNLANPDMVGHTGVFGAVVKAVETVDKCTEQIVEAGIKNGYSFIIIADHGNADYLINDDGTPHTAHTLNLVPCFIIDDQYKSTIKNGKLADVAPTILKILGIEIPNEMNGEVLI